MIEIGTLFGVGAVGNRLSNDSNRTELSPHNRRSVRGPPDSAEPGPCGRRVRHPGVANGRGSKFGARGSDRTDIGSSKGCRPRRTCEQSHQTERTASSSSTGITPRRWLAPPWADALAAPGALVILDDYGDPIWPGVAEALDRYLASPGRGNSPCWARCRRARSSLPGCVRRGQRLPTITRTHGLTTGGSHPQL